MAGEDLLNELKLQFDRELDIKTKLDAKASGVITMSGAVTTVFMGFGAFILRDLQTASWVTGVCIGLLIGAAVLTTIGIYLSSRAYRLRDYHYPLKHKTFYDPNTEELNASIVQQFIQVPKSTFEEHMVNSYLECNRRNSDQNSEKASLINDAQNLYILALALIPVFVLVVSLAKFIK